MTRAPVVAVVVHYMHVRSGIHLTTTILLLRATVNVKSDWQTALGAFGVFISLQL